MVLYTSFTFGQLHIYAPLFYDILTHRFATSIILKMLSTKAPKRKKKNSPSNTITQLQSYPRGNFLRLQFH